MPLLEPKPEALRPGTARAPSPDRVPGWKASGSPAELRAA